MNATRQDKIIKHISLLIFLVVCLLEPSYSNAEEGEFSAFDIYVGDTYYGLAYGVFGGNWIEFDNADDIVAILPPLRDEKQAYALFEGRIEEEKTIEKVGTVVLNLNEFRVDIYIAKELALVRSVEDLETLPDAKLNTALRNKIDITGSSPIEQISGDNIALSHETLVGRGKARLRSAGTHSSSEEYEVTALQVEYDTKLLDQEVTVASGVLETIGHRFGRSLDFYGFSLGSNRILLNRDPLLRASEVEIFLPARSRVEVYEDSKANGRVLYTNILEFGTTALDTRTFPDGSYNIEIVITDSQGNEKTEIRPFRKSRKLTPRTKPEINVAAGYLRNNMDLVHTPFFFGLIRKRISDSSDLSLSFTVSNDEKIMEASYNKEAKSDYLPGDFFFNLIGAVNGKRELAGIEGSVSWKLNKTFLSLRASRALNKANAIPDTERQELFLSSREAYNVNLTGPLTLFDMNARYAINGQWSKSGNQNRRYRIGPSLDIEIFRNKKYPGRIKAEYIITDDDRQALLSLAFKNRVGAWQKGLRADIYKNRRESSLSTRASYNYDGQRGQRSDWRKDLQVYSSFRADPAWSDENSRQNFFDGRVNYLSDWARSSVYMDKNLSESKEGTIGGSVTNTLLWNSEGVFRFSGKNLGMDSAILAVELKGNAKGKVAVFLDGSQKDIRAVGDVVYLRIPTYKSATIEVKPTSDSKALFVDEQTKKVFAYPGNVLNLEFILSKQLLVFGRFIMESGSPLANVRFKQDRLVSYTDEDGNFDLDLVLRDEKDLVIDVGGYSCNIPKLKLLTDDDFLDIGDIICFKTP